MAVSYIGSPQKNTPAAPLDFSSVKGFKGFKSGLPSISPLANAPSFNQPTAKPPSVGSIDVASGRVVTAPPKITSTSPLATGLSLEQLRAMNAPKRAALAAQENAKAKTAASYGPVKPSKPAAPSGFQTKLNATDPSAIGGALMNQSGTQTGTQQGTSGTQVGSGAQTGAQGGVQGVNQPGVGSSPDLVKARQDYLASLSPTPGVTSAQQSLTDLAQKEANLTASRDLGLANIQDQPIAMPFITGQQAGLQRQAAAQMGALTAQEPTLQAKLASEQANMQAAQQKAQAALGFASPTPVSVSAGSTLVNPQTGQPLYTAPSKPIVVSGTGTLVDPTTGQVIAQGSQAVAGGLDQNAISALASQAVATGSIPSLRYIPANQRGEVLNAVGDALAAQGLGGQALAVRQAAYKSDTQSLAQQQKYSDTINRSFNTAKSNLNSLISFMNKNGLNQNNIPLQNQIENKVKAGLTDPGSVAALRSYISGLRAEYAQVLARGGEVTDAARSQSASLIPDNLSPDQLQQVADQLNTEGQNAISESQGQISDIQSRIGTYGNDVTSGSDTSTDTSGDYNW